MPESMLTSKALTRNLFYRGALSLLLPLFLSGGLLAEELTPCNEPSGNALYLSGEYPLASLSFYQPRFENSRDCAERYSLARMRQGEFEAARDALRNRQHTSSYLLRMFAGIPLNDYNSVLFDRDQILLREASDRQKDVARLLGLSVYLDAGDYPRASRGLEELQRSTEQEDLRLLIGKVRTDLLEYENLDRKSPWLAGGLAALLPGAGHIYTEHYTDATLSFFWNGVFLGGGAYLYNLENNANVSHAGSIIFGLAGLIFYAANITGAIGSAHRFNYFQERKLQQKIRERYFNLDFIEKQSGLTFTVE